MVAARPSTRNQARIATNGSPLPLWERARVRVSRAQARHCGRDARAPRGAILAPASALYPVIPAKAGIRKAADSAEGAKRRGAKGEGRKKVVESGDRGTPPQPRHCERRTLPVELYPHDCGVIALYTASGGNSKIAPPAFWIRRDSPWSWTDLALLSSLRLSSWRDLQPSASRQGGRADALALGAEDCW